MKLKKKKKVFFIDFNKEKNIKEENLYIILAPRLLKKTSKIFFNLHFLSILILKSFNFIIKLCNTLLS